MRYLPGCIIQAGQTRKAVGNNIVLHGAAQKKALCIQTAILILGSSSMLVFPMAVLYSLHIILTWAMILILSQTSTQIILQTIKISHSLITVIVSRIQIILKDMAIVAGA